MSKDNLKTIDVGKTYNENMQFLQEEHQKIYNQIRFFESQLTSSERTQRYELKYLKTHFDVYDNTSENFLYNQNSYEYSQSLVEQISNDTVKNKFQPYQTHNFDSSFMDSVQREDIMAKNFTAIAPLVDYTDKYIHALPRNKNIHKFIFFGTALGFQIQEMNEQHNCKVFLICEPNLELFRLSLFTVNYKEISQKTDILFSIADEELLFQEKCARFLIHKYILNHDIHYNLFSLTAAPLIKQFQSAVSLQSFITFSYHRRFMATKRPLEYMNSEFDFLNVSEDKSRVSVLSNKPILILAAGPSLLKNIQWLKDNADKFIIISISANLKLLYKHKIKPDIIIHLDSEKEVNLNNFEEIDMNYFSDAMVLLSSLTHMAIAEKFANNKIFMIQAFTVYFNKLGRLVSFSVGEVAYAFALLYNAKEIYLLGLDFALDPTTNESHSSGHQHNVAHKDIKNTNKHDDLNLQYNFHKIKGNFVEEINTTSILYASLCEFDIFTHRFKQDDTKIHNLSNGAYLGNTKALQVENLDLDCFTVVNKTVLKEQLHDEFLKNSKNSLDKEDRLLLNRKVKNAKHIKQLIKLQLSKKSYKQSRVFLNDISALVEKIIKEESKTNSEDLNKILLEYTRLVSHYVYDLCERSSNEENVLVHVQNLNELFCTQLVKIVDKYLETMNEYLRTI